METSWPSAANSTSSGPNARVPMCLNVGLEPLVAVDPAADGAPDVAMHRTAISASLVYVDDTLTSFWSTRQPAGLEPTCASWHSWPMWGAAPLEIVPLAVPGVKEVRIKPERAAAD